MLFNVEGPPFLAAYLLRIKGCLFAGEPAPLPAPGLPYSPAASFALIAAYFLSQLLKCIFKLSGKKVRPQL